MTEEQIELGRRAVACKAWRWMAGMLRGDGFRCTWVDEDERELAAPTWCANGIEWLNRRAGPKDLPDLTDPATLGCLLALVREAHLDPMASATRGKYTPDMVYVDLYHVNENGPCRGVAGFAATEAEALVHALENAR